MPEDDLKKRLTPLQYEVTQHAATEHPFTGEYDDFDERESMWMSYLASRCLVHWTNTMQDVVGRASPNRSQN